MSTIHDRKALQERFGQSTKVSWWQTEFCTIQCDPDKLQEVVEYLEGRGYVRIKWRHPPRRDAIACDLTKMIVEAEKD